MKVEKQYDAYKKQLSVRILQTQDEKLYFQFPLDIDIYQENKATRHTVWVKARGENTFNFPISKAPDLVNINPEGVILMEEQDPKTVKEYLYQVQHAPDLKSRMQAITALGESEGKEVLLAALHDPYFKVRNAALERLSDYPLSRKELAQVKKLATSDPENLTKSAAIWLLAGSKENKHYASLYEKALNIPSGAVKNAALNAIARTNPKQAKNFLEKANPKDLDIDELSSLAGVIADNQMQQYLPTLMPYLVNYPFLEEDNPQIATDFKKAYLWAMSLDNKALVELMLKALKDFTQEENGEKVKHALWKVIDLGIDQKKKLPDTAAIKEQIQMLEELKSKIK